NSPEPRTAPADRRSMRGLGSRREPPPLPLSIRRAAVSARAPGRGKTREFTQGVRGSVAASDAILAPRRSTILIRRLCERLARALDGDGGRAALRIREDATSSTVFSIARGLRRGCRGHAP